MLSPIISCSPLLLSFIKCVYHRRFGVAVAALAVVLGMVLPDRLSAQMALGKKKFVGNILTGNKIHSNFSSYWNQVTPENDGKWGSVESSQGVYNWGWLDNDYNYAVQNEFPFKEHTLIWGNQQPGYLLGLDSAQQYQAIDRWIDTCGKRYPLAALVDVVNEPLPGHAPPDGLSGHANYKKALGGDGATGWDWLITAFELARKYWSPSTKLLINDYGILNSPGNTNAYIVIINLLKSKGLIDGIGCQGHGFESVSAATIKANLDKLAETGLPVYISEFDLNIADHAQQKAKYQELFPVMFEHPAVKGITLWGYTLGETWRSYTYLDTLNGGERPALVWLRTYLTDYLLPPQPISPVNATGIERNPALTWRRSVGGSRYHLQVAGDGEFSSVAIDTTLTDTTFQISVPLQANMKYYWHVYPLNASDSGNYCAPQEFTTGDLLGVRDDDGIPDEFILHQNYPNPFNPSTTIRFEVPRAAQIELTVYTMLGQRAAVLVDDRKEPGEYSVVWNASSLSSGVYWYRLKALTSDGVSTVSTARKLVLLK